MEKELLELVFSYANGKRRLDKNYFEEVINIALKYYPGREFKGIKWCKDFPSGTQNIAVAGYDMTSGYIFCFLNGINEVIDVYKEKYKDVITDYEMSVFVHFQLAYSMLHEFYHFTEKDIEFLEVCSLEKQIISNIQVMSDLEIADLLTKGYSNEQIIEMYEKKNDLFLRSYYANYNIAPNERRANINSLSVVSNAILPIKDEYPNVLNHSLALLHLFHCLGYKRDKVYGIDVLKSPMVSFFEGFCKDGVIDHMPFEWYDQNPFVCLDNVKKLYGFEERFKYGLPIDYDEFEVEKQKYLVNKHYIKIF